MFLLRKTCFIILIVLLSSFLALYSNVGATESPSLPLTLTCTKEDYTTDEPVSCTIRGGVGTKICWMRGPKNTEMQNCSARGWKEDSNKLMYNELFDESEIGGYLFYVKDATGKIASARVRITDGSRETDTIESSTISFKANNCSIAEGKSTCASSVFVRASSGRTFSVNNTTRGISSPNLLNPRTTAMIPGTKGLVYTISETPSGNTANYISYGKSNTLTLSENGDIIARAIASAQCAPGTAWNGKICLSTGDFPPTYIDVMMIEGEYLSENESISFTKSEKSPLRTEGKIYRSGNGLAVDVRSDKSTYYIRMPVVANGTWNSENSPTDEQYKAQIVKEGANTLTYSLIDLAKSEVLSKVDIPVQVTFADDTMNNNDLSDADKRKANALIARIQKQICTLSSEKGLALIDASIKRIERKSPQSALDKYMLEQLRAQREEFDAFGCATEEDYIEKIDTILRKGTGNAPANTPTEDDDYIKKIDTILQKGVSTNTPKSTPLSDTSETDYIDQVDKAISRTPLR